MSAAQPHPSATVLRRSDRPGHQPSPLSLVASPGGSPYDDFEVSGLRMLGAGHHRALARQLAAGDRHDLVAELLAADARLRELEIDVASLQGLVERVDGQEPVGSRLWAWAHSLLAERLTLDGQPAALLVAKHALDVLESGVMPLLPPLALRYARARLTRVEAGAWILVASPDGMDGHLRRRDEAVSDLLACGFMAEVHATRGIAAGMVSTLLFEDILENHARLVDARAALGEDDDSLWPTMVDYFLAVSCFETGDMVGALEAWDRMDRSQFRQRRLAVIPRYGRAFFRLVTAGASPLTVQGIERALSDVRQHDPRVAQHWYAHVAHTLADMGSRAAGHFARLESELPGLDLETQVYRRILDVRVDALAGEPVSTDEAVNLFERAAGFGHVRRSARLAVRLGHDLAAGGDRDGADTVRNWGMDRLPGPERQTVWESWWCRSLDEGHAPAPRLAVRGGIPAASSPSAPPALRRLEVRVLAPTVEVEVDGKPVTLSDAQAKLLLALVVAHPAPLHVERASDVLWPDEMLAVTRSRLNSLVHRLRRVLHPHGDAIGRTGDLLTLDGDHCRVDLWWFQRSLAGDADARRRALLSVRGNLGDTQFPYEEGFFDERHRLSGDWVRHACRAHRTGEVALADLEPALTSLKLSSDDLDLRLS